MIEIEDIKLFERAHEGKLSTSEVEQFQLRLNTDKKLRFNYEKYQEIIAAIHDQQHYDSLKGLLDENYKSRNWLLSPEEEKSRKLGPVILGAVIVILLIVVVSTIWFVSGESKESQSTTSPSVESTDNKKTEEFGLVEDEFVQRVDSVDPSELVANDETDVRPDNPTAFMISQQGYFLTQYSLVKDPKSLRLRQNDSTEFKVEIVATDSVLDLAVLKLSDGNWPTNLRLPYRLATTRALPGTEVMLVKQHGTVNHAFGMLTDDESNATKQEYYHISSENSTGYFGGPVISRNGNIVAVVIGIEGKQTYLKSTYINGFLAQQASQISDYRIAVDNRLAGLERDIQIQRVEPFVMEVIRFY